VAEAHVAAEEAALDLLVVGAGPAGVAAALTGRARGLRTLLVDKATFPRDKTCGDGLTANALRLLERLGVHTPAATDFAVVRETVVVSPSGRHVHLPLPGEGVHSAVVPRLHLDRALVDRARAAGVELREAAPVIALDKEHDLEVIRAHLGDGTSVRTRFVVAADGHWSTVRRLRHPAGPTDLGTWHAFRQYFRGVNDRRQWVLFERDLLPGYAWVFPLPEGRANVGFGVLRGAGVNGKALAHLASEFASRPQVRAVLGPDAEPEGRMHAWPIPSSFEAARLTDGRVLYAGDAASVVDPLTGEGIAQALETGILAAEAIARGTTPDMVAARYRRDVTRAIGRDLRFAARLRRVVVSSPTMARAGMRAADLCDWTRRSFARWMFEDYPRAIVLTPDRWRRGMFTPAGAYHQAS
jgi:menaquinone-9 beta-reductase